MAKPVISTGTLVGELGEIRPYVDKDGKLFAVFKEGEENEAVLYAELLRQAYEQHVPAAIIIDWMDRTEKQIQGLRHEIRMLAAELRY